MDKENNLSIFINKGSKNRNRASFFEQYSNKTVWNSQSFIEQPRNPKNPCKPCPPRLHISNKMPFKKKLNFDQEYDSFVKNQKIQIESQNNSADHLSKEKGNSLILEELDTNWIFNKTKLKKYVYLQEQYSKEAVGQWTNSQVEREGGNQVKMISKMHIFENLLFCLKNKNVHDLSFNKGICFRIVVIF